MDKYLSIITNFGCHGKCPYCIVRENGIDVPKTTLEGLDNLINEVNKNKCNIVSISGGGDPLHNYNQHIDYYAKLIDMLQDNNIRLEMHTSYINSQFPMDKCHRVVYHLQDIHQLYDIKRQGNEKVRVVFVATRRFSPQDFILIARAVDVLPDIDELSFRQLVDNDYKTMYYNHETLKWGHEKGLWHYIEQNDYNLYYVNGQIFTEFSKIHR